MKVSVPMAMQAIEVLYLQGHLNDQEVASTLEIVKEHSQPGELDLESLPEPIIRYLVVEEGLPAARLLDPPVIGGEPSR